MDLSETKHSKHVYTDSNERNFFSGSMIFEFTSTKRDLSWLKVTLEHATWE